MNEDLNGTHFENMSIFDAMRMNFYELDKVHFSQNDMLVVEKPNRFHLKFSSNFTANKLLYIQDSQRFDRMLEFLGVQFREKKSEVSK